jgi:hypothetical protein
MKQAVFGAGWAVALAGLGVTNGIVSLRRSAVSRELCGTTSQ